jgi:hypothetical protein
MPAKCDLNAMLFPSQLDRDVADVQFQLSPYLTHGSRCSKSLETESDVATPPWQCDCRSAAHQRLDDGQDLMSSNFLVPSFKSVTWSAAGTDVSVKVFSSYRPLPCIDIEASLSQSQQSFPTTTPIIVWILTSSNQVTTTVRSANFRPASASSAFFASAAFSYFKKILPTPADCRDPPLGRGILMSRIVPYLAHSSRTSSTISGDVSNVQRNQEGQHTFVILIPNQILGRNHVQQL